VLDFVFHPWTAPAGLLLCLAGIIGLLALAHGPVPLVARRVANRSAAGLAVLGILLYPLPQGLRFVPAGGSADTEAFAAEGSTLVVADWREARFTYGNVGRGGRDLTADVLRLHVLDAASGELRCRVVVGYGGSRLIDVLGGAAWVARADFATLDRVRSRDCEASPRLERGWGEAKLRRPIHETTYLGQGRFRAVAEDGEATTVDFAEGAFDPGAPRRLVRADDPAPRSPGVRAVRSGGRPEYQRLRFADGGETSAPLVSPSVVLARDGLAVIAHRDALDGPLLLSAFRADGEEAWRLSEEALFGSSAGGEPAPMGFELSGDLFVVDRGRVARLGVDGTVRWRQRV
jgi:hypothetical protein